MSKWKTTTLGNIANIITGPFGSQLHQSDYVNVGIPSIMPQNIGSRTVDFERIAYISESDAERLSRYRVKEHDIVYSRRGDVEKHAYITKELTGALCGTGCLRARFTNKEVYPEFISLYLDRPETKKWIRQHIVGSSMPNLNSGILSDMPISYPPKINQISISKTLTTIENKIKLNNRILAELEEMAKTIYDYWFVQFDFPNAEGKPYRSSGGEMVWNEQLKMEIPKGWNYTTLGAIINVFDSQRIPLSQNERDRMKGSIPYYGATGIMDYVNKYIFDGQYILIAEDGSVMDGDGFPIVQMIWGKTWINNHAHVLQGKSGYSNELLYLMLKKIPVVKIMTGSIQKKINQDNLCTYRVVNIPSEQLVSMNKILFPLFEKTRITANETIVLTKLRDWLLPMLMNGQVTVE